jgi:hypothetical protein
MGYTEMDLSQAETELEEKSKEALLMYQHREER